MGPETPILHTKVQGNRPTGSREDGFLIDFTIYGHGSHICHVTKRIHAFINFHFLVPKMFPMKTGYKWPSGF